MATTYCEVTDLLTGQLPMPTTVSPQKYVETAADEINAALAPLYVVPIVIPAAVEGEEDPHLESRLVLKIINVRLATGRLFLAVASGGEDTELHAYGYSLLREAQAMLARLASGATLLPSAEPKDKPAVETKSLPTVLNADPYSQVDAFYQTASPYGAIMSPTGFPARLI